MIKKSTHQEVTMIWNMYAPNNEPQNTWIGNYKTNKYSIGIYRTARWLQLVIIHLKFAKRVGFKHSLQKNKKVTMWGDVGVN